MTSGRRKETCKGCRACTCGGSRNNNNSGSNKKKKRQTWKYAYHVKAYREMQRRLQIHACRDYKEYEKKRREESRTKRLRIKKLKKLILASRPGMPEYDAARFLCLVDMVFRDNSLRGHVTYMNDHPGTEYAYGLKKVPSKSGIHDWAMEFSGMMDWVCGLLSGQAGDDACGTLLGDSSGFSIMKCEDRGDAKNGVVSRRGFDKLHILLSPHGMIAACAVTGGRRHDSPVFREMFEGWIPRGTGHVMLDAAYPCKANCRVIRESGRIPVICPKSNMRPKGFNALAEMLRRHRDDREGFDRLYHKRSLVETAFSVIKERFGATARAKLEPVRALLLTLKCISYNLVS